MRCGTLFGLKLSERVPNFEGLLIIHSGSRVDLELFLKENPGVPGGTSSSIHAGERLGEIPQCPFMNFCLTLSESVCGVWL